MYTQCPALWLPPMASIYYCDRELCPLWPVLPLEVHLGVPDSCQSCCLLMWSKKKKKFPFRQLELNNAGVLTGLVFILLKFLEVLNVLVNKLFLLSPTTPKSFKVTLDTNLLNEMNISRYKWSWSDSKSLREIIAILYFYGVISCDNA